VSVTDAHAAVRAPLAFMAAACIQVLCTPAKAAGADKKADKADKADKDNGSAAKSSENGRSNQTYLIATKELRVVAAGTTAAQSFLSSFFPEQGAVVGMPAGMQITACDSQGNPRREGGDRFTIDIPGLPKHAVQLTDRGDGTYALQVPPCLPPAPAGPPPEREAGISADVE